MFRHANEKEIEKIIKFYDLAIETNQASEFNIRWQKNVHPSHSLIQSSVQRKELLVDEENGDILSACILNYVYHKDYHQISWGINAKDNEIGVIHVFATSPKHFRKGIGTKMLQSMIKYAAEMDMKTIRLDVFKRNTPAIALYKHVGFQCRGELYMDVPHIGEELFEFYEYVL